MERAVSFIKIFSKDSHGFIVLSDITNDKSLQETIKWKSTVDGNQKFIDGGLLPSVLVRNKIDLLKGDTDDDKQVNEFAEQNKFIKVFKTSAKMGNGIEECMEFIIANIIDRMEKCGKEEKDPFKKDKANIVLVPAKGGSKKEKNKGGKCWG